MLIETLHEFEGFGKVKFYKTIRVLEIDGLGSKPKEGVFAPDVESLTQIGRKTWIVIPVKNEPLIKLRGVLAGIPHSSPVIIISASDRKPVDIYKNEVELAKIHYKSTGHKIVVMHQHDPAWREGLYGTPLQKMLENGNGVVRKGKGEGMLLAFLYATANKAEYVGLIDSDNYSPGAVHEYVWSYYAGFLLSKSPYTLIRLKWPYKEKLAGGELPYLRLRGRVSTATNDMLNYTVSLWRKIETDIIATANSGEHAVSVPLGMKMGWGSRYTVEPYQLVYLLEKCWIGLGDQQCPIEDDSVNIVQIETRSPHIHAERGLRHIVSMMKESLSTIYYSTLANDHIREMIKNLLSEYTEETDVPEMEAYPPPEKGDVYSIINKYADASEELYIFE
jgi:mannosyl-3-phosphoglycerate synthase